MKIIPLTQGKEALVDDEDYDRLMTMGSWFAHFNNVAGNGYWYAETRSGSDHVKMHRVILHAPDNKIVDHIDGNGLNNQKSNLRLATQSQNQANSKLREDNTSGLKGVSYKHRISKWAAKISYQGEESHLGYFEDKIKAAEAYDRAAKRLHGEYARLNFP